MIDSGSNIKERVTGLNRFWQKTHPLPSQESPNGFDAIMKAANKNREEMFAGRRSTTKLGQVEQELKETKDRLYLDELTNVYSINYYKEFKKKKFDKEKHHQRIAIILIDFDGFKEINDAGGHAAGNETLKNAAAFFSAHFRESDQIIQLAEVVRAGGDEFIIICSNDRNSPDFIEKLQQKMLSLETNDDKPINFSYGIAIYDKDIDGNLDDTEKRADEAMYENKKSKKTSYQKVVAKLLGALGIKIR